MRLYKKAAVCLLAAAMSLCMLTACGGGGGSTPENPADSNPSNPGGDSSTVDPEPEPVPTPDDVVLPDIGDDGEDESKPAKTPIDPKSSKTAVYYNKYANATEGYIECVSSTYSQEDNYVMRGPMAMTFAYKGNAIDFRVTEEARSGKRLTLEYLKLNTGEMYYLFRAGQAAVKADEFPLNTSNPKLPSQMWSTKVKVGGTEYYAETFIDENGGTETICYAADGMPKYGFNQSNNGRYLSVTTYRIMRFGAGSSQNLCQIPAGFKIYTQSQDDQGNMVLTDAQGKKYTATVDNSRLTVTDESGNDVTSSFGWLEEIYNL